jgi:hypothetical protein
MLVKLALAQLIGCKYKCNYSVSQIILQVFFMKNIVALKVAEFYCWMGIHWMVNFPAVGIILVVVRL